LIAFILAADFSITLVSSGQHRSCVVILTRQTVPKLGLAGSLPRNLLLLANGLRLWFNMARIFGEQLIGVLSTSKAIFWQENEHRTEAQTQALWEVQWNCLSSCIGATPEKNTSSVPSKRTLSVGGPGPSKRQELVGVLAVAYSTLPDRILESSRSGNIRSRTTFLRPGRFSSEPKTLL
jgi:hypothetical protein